jgi:hypothetical protein
MKISEMINKLSVIMSQYGDLNVTITDGYDAKCYEGEFSIQMFVDIDDGKYADIGIGGCNTSYE